jgi:hypothetical protein
MGNDSCVSAFVTYAKLETQKAKDKSWKKEKAVIKESLLTRSEYLKMAQQVFNAWIRIRDEKESCISCGTNKPNIQYHAGHYKSVGACPELRFNEFNVHRQCATCNNILSGNIIEYRKNLVKKIGLEKVEEIENYQLPLKLSIDEIKLLIKHYKQKIKNHAENKN